MKQFTLSILLLQLAIGVGCSKEEAEPEAAWNGGDAAAPAVPEQEKVSLEPALKTLQSDIEAKRYNDAVSALAAMSRLPKTSEQEVEFRRAAIEAQAKLSQQAETDPAARMALQRYGQMMTGR